LKRRRPAAKSRPGFAALVAAEVLPAAQQEPALGAPVLAHDVAGAEELGATHLVDGPRGVLEDVELVEHDLCVGELLGHGVHVGLVHVDAHRLDRRPLASVQAAFEKPFERGLGPVAGHVDHLAVDEIGEHRPVVLTPPALNLVGTEVARAAARSQAIPAFEKRLLRPSGLAPAHAVAHGGVAGGHRLAVQADARLQATGRACLGLGEREVLGPNPAARAA